MSFSPNKSSQVKPFCSAKEHASWQAKTATQVLIEWIAGFLGNIRLRASDTLPSCNQSTSGVTFTRPTASS